MTRQKGGACLRRTSLCRLPEYKKPRTEASPRHDIVFSTRTHSFLHFLYIFHQLVLEQLVVYQTPIILGPAAIMSSNSTNSSSPDYSGGYSSPGSNTSAPSYSLPFSTTVRLSWCLSWCLSSGWARVSKPFWYPMLTLDPDHLYLVLRQLSSGHSLLP